MATLNIKDPRVHELAAELAALRHTSSTAAVRAALTEALERDREDRRGLAQRILELGTRSAEREAPFLTDDDLYDDHGLPR